ncbi:F-box domain [Macleaya cordata]|uniref:F-box domain n=1 Tax=Macleaya cordata TaxID=56857 RepID=A0A200R4Q7_MACCD|nr:F-box domain [Macleaya cordata]
MGIVVYERKKKRSSTSTAVPYFCEEIIMNILSRLPVDSQYNSCRFVCKLWYNIIYEIFHPRSDRLLIQNPIIAPKSMSLMEFNEGNDPQVGLIRDLNFNSFGTIRGTCNGLVLIQRYIDDDYKSFHLHVLNPLSRQCISLPPCDLSQLTEWFGIAFVPSSKEFKVVLAFEFQNEFRCEILTLGSSSDGRWRTITMPTFSRLKLYSNELPVSVNGVLHMKTGCRNHLISVDVGDETLHTTKLPNGNVVLKNMHLIEMGGSLGLIQHFYVLMDVWILEDFRKGEWTKLGRFNIEYPRPMISSSKRYRVQLIPVASFRNSEVIIFRTFDDYYRGLYSYDIKHQEMKKMEVELNDDIVCFPYTVAPFFSPQE